MNEIENVKQQIDDLPKGSITKKVIQGKDRYYLQWREADKVKTRYVKLSELPELSTQIEKRIALQQKLVELQVASIQYNVDTPAKMAAENGVVYDCCEQPLSQFFLNLEKGFCFESKNEQTFTFYNRLLHCGVIVELKNDEFKREYLDQLNACVSYYKEHEMQPGDNHPVGILLCNRKGPKMVEYATAGLDKRLLSTYKLKLPSKKELETFLKGEDIL